MAVIKGGTFGAPVFLTMKDWQNEALPLSRTSTELSVAAQEVVAFLRAHPDEDFNYTVSKDVFTFAQRTQDEIYVVEAKILVEHDLPLTAGPIALPKTPGVRYVCTYCDQTLNEVSPGQYRCARCV